MKDTGEILDKNVLIELLEKYGNAITCICFMGGDSDPQEVQHLSVFLRNLTGNRIKIAWYSGRQHLPEGCALRCFDFIKLGPYVEYFGGLDSASTNQRFYRIENGSMIDLTSRFLKSPNNIDSTQMTQI
jgi:anaerobic ribonucleoside-triphosphate reductase activating protein